MAESTKVTISLKLHPSTYLENIMFSSFKHYGIFLVIAIFVGGVLLSNRAGVNLTHHHELPLFDKQLIVCTGVYYKSCQVRIDTEVTKPEDFKPVLSLLSEAKTGDTITFYLAGNGGRGDSMSQLIYGIKHSKAHTVSVVEGDVYSAHAYLMTATNELYINPFAVVMFHRGSIYGNPNICDSAIGKKDRGHDAEPKCQQLLAALLVQDEQLVYYLLMDVLTEQEIKRVINGEDVYLTGQDLIDRGRAK